MERIYALTLCLFAVIPFATSLTCRVCNNARYLDECNTVEVCSNDQICYMEELITSYVYYQGGCKARSECSVGNHRRRSIEKRESPLTACARCCEHSENATDTSKRYCNDRLCGLHYLDDKHRALECYHCLEAPNVNECYGTELCSLDQVCAATMYSAQNGHRIYHAFQCRPRRTCVPGTTFQIINFANFSHRIIVGRELLEIAERTTNDIRLCEVCCADPLCNTGVCVQLLDKLRKLMCNNHWDAETLKYSATNLTIPPELANACSP